MGIPTAIARAGPKRPIGFVTPEDKVKKTSGARGKA